mmetsp:Transcript_4836/g.7410  ORF Transcript_4836/g.7410 Transcript_4836/m.7410 type:complete len:159 (-) Transcript_4836:74-550(-)
MPSSLFVPSSSPSDVPSEEPTLTQILSTSPTKVSSDQLSLIPSVSKFPSLIPSSAPSLSSVPSSEPSVGPTGQFHVARNITDTMIEQIANEFIKLKNKMKSSRGGTLVCGSIGKIAPDPYLYDWFEVRYSFSFISLPFLFQLSNTHNTHHTHTHTIQK